MICSANMFRSATIRTYVQIANAAIRHTTRQECRGICNSSKRFSEGNSKESFKISTSHGINYQADIYAHNINEIIDVFKADPRNPQPKGTSENILRAMSAYAGRPWQTARDHDGTLIGFIIVGRTGDSYVGADRLFVTPEERGRGAAVQLLGKIFEIRNEFPTGTYVFVGRKPTEVEHSIMKHMTESDKRPLTDRAMTFGVPEKCHPNMFPKSGDTFDVIPYRRGKLHDDLVYFDVTRIHRIPRDSFWKEYLNPQFCNCYVAVDKETKEVVGFGGIQTALDPSAQMVAPLYAENDTIAEVLFHHMLKHYKSGASLGFIYITENKGILNIIKSLGLRDTEVLEAFYLGDTPPPGVEYEKRVYLHCGSGLCLF